MILDKKRIIIANSKSSISFQTDAKRKSKRFWNRYIAVDGKKIYHIGNVCETCRFFFKRLENDLDGKEITQTEHGRRINELAQDVSDKLNQGLTTIEPELLDALKMIIPNGNYNVILSTAIPTLVSPGQPEDYFAREQFDLRGYYDANGVKSEHYDPKTDYYRLHTAVKPNDAGFDAFFEFLIPLFPITSLNQERISYYTDMLAQGNMPTAVALSVFDVDSEDGNNHEAKLRYLFYLCLAHYLIDGHHKAYAAAIAKKPLTIISFIAVDKSHGLATGDYFIEWIEDICKM